LCKNCFRNCKKSSNQKPKMNEVWYDTHIIYISIVSTLQKNVIVWFYYYFKGYSAWQYTACNGFHESPIIRIDFYESNKIIYKATVFFK
jgi:hypothetical protein